jgi:predicted O-methyltransferase YrrM
MNERIWSRWLRAGRVAWQRRTLSKVPPLGCDLAALRALAASDIEAVLRSPEIGAGWEAAAPRLDAVCAIADGTTEGVNPGDRRAIYYLIRGLRPRAVLEIGTHVGASTLHIAAALRDAAGAEDGEGPSLTTVDLRDVNDPRTGFWKRAGLARSPREMAADLGCGGFLRFVAGGSLSFFDRCDTKYDLVFLDGDHSAANVYREIPRALAVLRPNGVVLCHDVYPGLRPFWPGGRIEAGPWLAVERLQAGQPALAVLPLGELPWPTKMGSNVTSLALLTRRGS